MNEIQKDGSHVMIVTPIGKQACGVCYAARSIAVAVAKPFSF